MRILVVTEKCEPEAELRDGGARLVTSLRRAFGEALDIMQFDDGDLPSADNACWRRTYPPVAGDRFTRRQARADFVIGQVAEVAHRYTHVLFVHASMAFGLARRPLHGLTTWLFPMFLTPSYVASGELVPAAYTEMEHAALLAMTRILTPSHLERRQLTDLYNVAPARIRVVPRGVDRSLLTPLVRRLTGAPVLCSVGSIKRQKNTVGLVRTFARIRGSFPRAVLRVVGPVQDRGYAAEVMHEAERLGLAGSIEWLGPVAPDDLPTALSGAHLHLSASSCETFGRVIFETLALGLPNIVPLADNAAVEHLHGTPYTFFYGEEQDAVAAVEAALCDYSRRSELALEVGELFDDVLLARMLRAEVLGAEILAVSDFDGTLFHKHDSERTRRCVTAFQRYPRRVVCSARPIPDLLVAMERLGLTAHYIVGWSGAVVADSHGRELSRSVLSDAEARTLANSLPATAVPVVEGEDYLQFAAPAADLVALPGVRVEAYQETAYVGRWDSSKLHAVIRLLRHIDWNGRIRAFGDGPYDLALLTYFDGVLVRPRRADHSGLRTSEELEYDPQ